jgi:hypothetical protein
MPRWFRVEICLLLALSFPGYGQKADIFGKWYFDRFGGPHGEIVKDGEIAKANKQNEGFSFTFTRENKAILQQKNGATMTAQFQFIADRNEVILNGDTMRIMLQTSNILELYPISETKPAMFLKRSKDGKTAMSVQ